jgi:hypothetical protein
MSMFSLPTTSSPSDTGVSSVRVDEFAPVSTVNADGGGTVAFECTSPANSFWCPRLSYFNFRLKVTSRKADGTAEALTSTDASSSNLVTAGTVQFRSYPAAACVQSFSHSINGVTVETISDVQETAAFLNRTGMSFEYARTAGNSLYRLAGADGKRNSESVAPGGALQPWNKSGNTTTVFDCGFLPPSGVFSMPGSLPGGRHRFVITLQNDLRTRCLIMDSVRAAVTSSATNYVYCTIEEVRFHMCHLVPDAPVPVPRNVVLSIHPLTVVKSSLSASSGSSTHTLSVPPSTDRLFVGVNLATAGSTHGVQDSPDQFEPSLSVLQVQYAGQTLPNTAYQSLNKSATDRHVIKPYADFLAACGKLYLEQSAYDNMEEWSNTPIQGLSFEKSPNDSSTSVIVRCTRAATANDLVDESAVTAAAAANLVVCAQSHQAIVLTYGDDGLVSSCDSVVEL